MSQYLARLKELNRENPLPRQVPKVAKAPFDTFDTDQSRGVFENQSGRGQSLRESREMGSPPRPAEAFRAKIVRVPPFSCDAAPERYKAAWEALLAQCPPMIAAIVWQAAVSDCADLFGYWGLQLARLGFKPGDIFDVPYGGKPGGLAWAMKGSPVMALGPGTAQFQDGRIWRRG